ncbi:MULTISPECIES: helix-turn-helix domain-containing protein [Bacillus amyloliquefaciens group]|uniref:helix-turn-helix domain-containing protein n=1 Tax=Bacillus amyloliquefaciens group TaxID=1938374 RepID=UPI0022808018|nr:helix-turn-helix transcriptional regulator [Bacillus velezensis]MCY7442897.1 helix-turn-helix domain-containing protein [Bacillus velezensis]
MEITSELFELLRRHKNMTQEKFAELLGISKKTVSAIERKERSVSRRTQHRIIERIEITESLLEYKEKYDSLRELVN